MAIIQISKIQVRSGNLVDLPQLDEAEFGWASDTRRLFIGKTTPNENIEILTSYSNIDFSQLTGSYGNLNISNPYTGQVLVFDKASNAWLNAGGNANDPGSPSYWSSNPIHLGNVSTLKIGGGAIGYVLETDGTGNLSWTPKGVISANISAATKTNPVVITTSAENFFTDGDLVTITNVSGMTQLNGNSYYANVLTSNTFSLYSDTALTVPVNGTGFGTYTGNGRAVASVGGSGGGGGGAGGTTYSVQYNYAGVPTGDASFTWNNTTSTLTVTGTSNVAGNFNVTGNVTASRLVSNIATGTAPLQVTSTTRVSNLNVAYSNVTDFVSITTATTGLHYPMLANALTGNVAEFANANLSFDAATGLLTATRLSATGNIVTAGLVSATGNGTFGNVTATLHIGNLSGTGNSNVGNLGATGVFATTLSASGNANVGNLGTAGLITATGNITGGNLVTGGVLNVTGTANSSISGNLLMNAQNIVNANMIGAFQIISTLLTATGNANLANLGTGIITATGTVTGGNLATAGTLSAGGNANVGNLGTTTAIITTGNITTINSGLLQNGNSNITITANGNIAMTAAGGTTELIITSTGANINGTLSVSGNANVGNIGATNFVGNMLTTELSTGANTTLGNITGNWVLTSGSRLQATYADLAEYYEADQPYEAGTVLMFGGEKEVTVAEDGTTKVAGVVSTNPAYLMNSNCPGHKVAIALQGRVPVKVRGRVKKGDLMVSGGNGFARPWNHASIGMIIGKAIQDFDGIEGIIEVAVGRL